jgi:pyruvate formate lyase activating enzyme
VAIDPIEKKPFFHALPGSDALSFGMLGCDFRCGYCQNWLTSQTLRDESAGTRPHPITADGLVDLAESRGCPAVVSTYNEPLITPEWSHAVFVKAKERGLRCGFVSNGNATPQALDYLRPVLDLYKVDLKSFDKRHYAELGGSLDNVLRSIADIHERGLWLEIVTLVVPGFNSTDEELTRIAEFIAGISVDVPWHVTAFHSDYQMQSTSSTTPAQLLRAAQIGRGAGLRFVYCGNRPGKTDDWESTHCPQCDETVVERMGFHVLANRLENGACPRCGTVIPGVWS